MDEKNYDSAFQLGDSDMINDFYEAKRKIRLDELESKYQKDKSELERSRDMIGGIYADRQNALAGSYEKNRSSMNERFASSGINSGAGSQAALMQSGEYQRDSAALGRSRAQAMSDAERALSELEIQARGEINRAIAENDYQKAGALLQSYKENRANELKKAELLAGYGDFSAYGRIYGDETANAMNSVWAARNPDLAYSIGSIDREQYRQYTGRYPNR